MGRLKNQKPRRGERKIARRTGVIPTGAVLQAEGGISRAALTPPGRRAASASLHTSLQWPLCFDHSLRMDNRLEPRLHLKIKLEVSIPRKMLRPHPAASLSRAVSSEQTHSRIRQGCRMDSAALQHFRSDIAAKTDAHPGKSSAPRIPPQQISRSLKHNSASSSHPAAKNIQSPQARKSHAGSHLCSRRVRPCAQPTRAQRALTRLPGSPAINTIIRRES